MEMGVCCDGFVVIVVGVACYALLVICPWEVGFEVKIMEVAMNEDATLLEEKGVEAEVIKVASSVECFG